MHASMAWWSFGHVKSSFATGVNGVYPLENFNRTHHVAVLTQANEFYTKGLYRLISSVFYAKRLGMVS